jgi:RNA polymerase sigma factor (sigma-70 family)
MNTTFLERPPAEPLHYDAVVNMAEMNGVPAADAAFVTGDESALRQAYDAHGSMIYTFCSRALGPERAHDVTQEVFLSAWRARQRFEPSKGNLAAWLTAIAKNRIIDSIRSEKRHSDRRAPESTEDLGREGEAETTGDRLLVADALRTLPERPRKILTLHYFEGLTHPEISVRTNLPLGTVKSDIRRGLARIRAHMENQNV